MEEYRLIDPEDPERQWVITIDQDGKVLALKDMEFEANNSTRKNLTEQNGKTV